MREVDRAGQTVSATRFAELTGVSRERLRTWERRHGFPTPRRVEGGPRRYLVADVQRVVAVRLAAAEGVPLAVAISATALASPPSVAPRAAEGAVEGALRAELAERDLRVAALERRLRRDEELLDAIAELAAPHQREPRGTAGPRQTGRFVRRSAVTRGD